MTQLGRRIAIRLVAVFWIIGGAQMAARAESKTFLRPGVTVEALVDGQGPLVVMIPSLGRPAQDFDDLSARLVAEGFRTARVQPRGIGKSLGHMDGQTLFTLAEDTAAVIEGLGSKAIVIGHAFGQRQARALATARPELVTAVVALAAGGKVPISERHRTALFNCFDLSLPPDKRLDYVREAFFAPGNDPAVWRGGWHPEVARMQSAATQGTPLPSWWGGGQTPILVVQGKQDAIAPPENARLLKEEFGDRITVVEIDGAGHAMLPEQPRAVADAVLSFVRQRAATD